MAKEIKDMKDVERESSNGLGLMDLLRPGKMVEKIKELSQKASQDMANKRAIITKISNGFIVEFKDGMKNKVIFYNKFDKIIEDLKLFMR